MMFSSWSSLRRAAFAAILAIAAGSAACSDGSRSDASPSPTAPSYAKAPKPGPSPDTTVSTSGTTSGDEIVVPTLRWTKKVTSATASREIGPSGGSVSIPNGIRVIVPAGALAQATRVSVTRLAGSIVAYEFEPHGTTFAVPVRIEQPTLGTNLFKLDPAQDVQGAYFSDASSLDQSSGTGIVTEFEPTFISADRAWVTFSVKHFSGYLLGIP